MHYVEAPSLSYFLAGAWRRRNLILGASLAGLVVAGLAYVSVAQIFEPSTTLLVVQRAASSGKDDNGGASTSPETLAQIASSPSVIRSAVQRVGPEAVGFGKTNLGPSLYQSLRSWLRGPRTEGGVENRLDQDDVAAALLARSISVRTEPNSDIVRLSFRYRDPQVATHFVDALAASLIDRLGALMERPGALSFFQAQKEKFDNDFRLASQKLEGMAVSRGIYSLDDQRSLLLKRQSEIETAMSNARGSLEEKSGQRDGLVRQLKLLKPVTSSTYVSGLVDYLGSAEGEAPAVGANGARGRQPLSLPNSSDPPLLLVKVYQDNLVSLFRLNAEIAGLTLSQAQQQEEQKQISQRLVELSQQQAEFDKLKREASLAAYNAEVYAKRAVDEQIDRELRAAKFSQLRVLQPAVYPLSPVFPKIPIFAAAGLFLGAALSIIVFALVDFLAWIRSHPVAQYEDDPDSSDFATARARAALLRAVENISPITGHK